jgi:hypothetical protein
VPPEIGVERIGRECGRVGLVDVGEQRLAGRLEDVRLPNRREAPVGLGEDGPEFRLVGDEWESERGDGPRGACLRKVTLSGDSSGREIVPKCAIASGSALTSEP